MKIVFHPEAQTELWRAVSYYEERKPGLGDDFLLEVFSALSNIRSYPRSWPVLGEGVRRCLINRFPYGLVYSAEPEKIFILAVMHLRRYPDYWKGRR